MRYRSCVRFTDDAKVDELKRQGLRNKEIAELLGISESTVKHHSCGGVNHENQRQHDEAVKRLESKLSEMEYGTLVYVSGKMRNPTLKCLDCGTVFTTYRGAKRGCPTCYENRPRQPKKSRYTPKYDWSKPIVCRECGKEFMPKDRSSKRPPVYCSVRCYRRANGRSQNFKRRARLKGQGTYSWHRIYERDNGCCHICGEPVDRNDYTVRGGSFIAGPNYPSVDHVVPLSKGGSNTEENMRLAHCLCNSLKSDS